MTETARSRVCRAMANRPPLRVYALLPALVIAPAAAAPEVSWANTSTIGRTWPIVEPDALTEIEGRVAHQPASIADKYGPRSTWNALHAAPLARATDTRTRFVVPFYTLDEDIKLPDGRLLYAKGYTFNPLAYVTLPQRLIVVAPRDLVWALGQAREADYILLAAGGAHDADALTLSERHHRPLFILEDRVKQRLGLTVAPVIVHQVGQRLELDEVRRDPGARARS